MGKKNMQIGYKYEPEKILKKCSKYEIALVKYNFEYTAIYHKLKVFFKSEYNSYYYYVYKLVRPFNQNSEPFNAIPKNKFGKYDVKDIEDYRLDLLPLNVSGKLEIYHIYDITHIPTYNKFLLKYPEILI